MKTLLDAVIAAGAGAAIKLEAPKSNHTLEVVAAGTYATLSISLEGSISGIIWETLATRDFVTADFTAGGKIIRGNDKLVEMVRANITTYNSGTRATGSFISDGVNLASGDTVTVGSVIYKFRTASLASSGDVIIGASAATSLIHLGAAINHTTNATTDYNCATANADASASTISATRIIIWADDNETAGNDVAIAETSAHLSIGNTATTLAGGVDKGRVTVNYCQQPS
jgi:hypothetical protein